MVRKKAEPAFAPTPEYEALVAAHYELIAGVDCRDRTPEEMNVLDIDTTTKFDALIAASPEANTAAVYEQAANEAIKRWRNR